MTRCKYICKNTNIRCKSSASFNIEDEITPKFCKTHIPPGIIMINVRNDIRCNKIINENNRCNLAASYNYYGNLKRLYCNEHKLPNMINIINNKCENQKCNKIAKFNYNGFKIGRFCDKHKLKDMINIFAEKCIYIDKETNKQCSLQASFNYKGCNKRMYCSIHKLENMINIVNKRCIYINKKTNEQCFVQASFNYKDTKTPIYCSIHKLENMININIKMCIQCGDISAKKKNKFLCYDCNPVKTKKQKEKENAVRDLLIKNEITFIQDKAVKKNGCLKRPDFLIECNKYYLIIEVDEYQHKEYDEEDEKHRMELIKKALELPTKFIRYNPDNKNFNWKVKRSMLIEKVNEFINKEELVNDDPVYLFYE